MRIRQIICTDVFHKKEILNIGTVSQKLFYVKFSRFSTVYFMFFSFWEAKQFEISRKKIKSQKSKTKYGILYRNENNGFQLTRNVFIPEATSGIEGEFLAWRRGPESLPPGPGPRGARLKGGRRLKVEALIEGLASEIRSWPPVTVVVIVVVIAPIVIPSGGAHVIVGAAFGGVGEDLVGLRDLFEPLFRLLLRVGILVRVPLPGQPPVGLTNVTNQAWTAAKMGNKYIRC